MITVALLFGGSSSEREISIKSAQSVGTALENAGYSVHKIDTAPLKSDQLLQELKNCDVVFPILHGAGGEDGKPQAWLESHGFAYIGSDSSSSEICFNKARYKNAVSRFGIVTPQGGLVNRESFITSDLITRPFVLKPNDGGSSVDTFIAREPGNFDSNAINKALDHYGEMLLEELIIGTELTVGILNESTLPVIEIIPPSDEEFDYENKYNGKTQELCPPEDIAEDIQKTAQTIALKIHRQLRLRDMSRTDMMLRSSDNALIILETNTIPGMTDQSLLPKAAAASGVDMVQLVRALVDSAIARTSSQ